MCVHRGDHRTGNCRECHPPTSSELQTAPNLEVQPMPQVWEGVVDGHSAPSMSVNAPITDMPLLWQGDQA